MPFSYSSDGTPIHCEIHGTGPVNLIFLHGWGGSHETWDGMVEHLNGEHFRSFFLDLRGHGKSGVPPSGYTFKQLSNDVLSVADSQGTKTFVVVGFSMGGKLACHLAAKHSDRVSALVLIAPIGPGNSPIDRESGLQACRQAGDWQQNETVFKNWFAPSTNGEIVKNC